MDHVVAILRKEQVNVKMNSENSLRQSPLGSITNSKQIWNMHDQQEVEPIPVPLAKKRIEWMLIGRTKAHYKEIISMFHHHCSQI